MMNRSAFTIVELLVVVLVIAILSAMAFPAFALISKQAKSAQTRATMSSVRMALQARAVEKGSSVSPVPHPLANTRANAGLGLTRLLFVRNGDATYAAGTTVTATGYALSVASTAWLESAGLPMALQSDDRFSGIASAGDVPGLFGLRRSEMMVLGEGVGLVGHLRLPDPREARWADANNNGKLDTPYDLTKYSMQTWLDEDLGDRSGTLPELTAARLFEGVLPSDLVQDLRKGKRILDTTTGALAVGNRLRTPDGIAVKPGWEPGHRFDAGVGSWVPYRLRGPALVDAWGNEILVRLNAVMGLVFESAGPDGCFRWHPGRDGAITTAAHAATASGDDRKADMDNIIDGKD